MEQTFGQPQVKGSREDPSGHSDWIQIFGLGEGEGEGLGEGEGEGAELGVGGHLQVFGSGRLESGQITAGHIFGFGHWQVLGSRAEPSGQRDWMQMTGGQAHVTEFLNVPSGQTKPPSQIAAPAGFGDGLADRRSIWLRGLVLLFFFSR